MLKNLESIVLEEAKKSCASHGFNHFLRVAKGAVWFCDILKTSEHEKEIAYSAGLLHDIVRPPTEKYDPLEEAIEKSKKILESLKADKNLIKEILDAIHAHHFPDPKKKAGYSVFLADKILEQMGAYVVFRRAVFMGESPDFNGEDRREATISHWTIRMNKWSQSKFEKRFEPLVKYQFSWMEKFLSAFKKGEEWAVHINNCGFESGAKKITTDSMLASFNPKYKEEKEYLDEAFSYIRGDKLEFFKSLLK